ncbi:MAG: hypothetical protein K9J13_00050 [Saprospiraceae bacterium]|nr:hypothetical protein [Saprospiraceae bacterium]
MKNYYSTQNKILIIFILLFFCISSHAQENGQNVDIKVVGPYTPTISDAFKINSNPKITDTLVLPTTLQYFINSKKIETPFKIEPIKAAKMNGVPLKKLYNHYAKAGFGNYTTPYFEYFYNSTRSRDLSYGLHFKHLSSSGKIKDYAFSGFSDTEFDAYSRKFLKKHILSADIGYKRNVVHYYGYKPNDFADTILLPGKKDIKNPAYLAAANFTLESIFNPNKKLNHKFSLGYYNYSDYSSVFENNINLKADINKNVNLFKLTESQNLGISAEVDFYNDRWDSLNQKTNNAVIELEPYLSTEISKGFNVKIGIVTSVIADTISDIHFHPLVEIDATIIDKILIFNAGITGSSEKNSFKGLNDINPFSSCVLPLEFTYNQLVLFGGIKSSISKYIDFSASVSVSEIENKPFFVNEPYPINGDTLNPVLSNQFSVVYDDLRMFNAKTEISYQKSEKLRILLGANYYQYSGLITELQAWHMPNYDVSLGALYNLKNKILIRADITAIGDRYAKVWNETTNMAEAKKLKPIIDANLGVEYRYSKILSGFINFNNITGTRYYIWNNYPSYRFNLLAGVTYSL